VAVRLQERLNLDDAHDVQYYVPFGSTIRSEPTACISHVLSETKVWLQTVDASAQWLLQDGRVVVGAPAATVDRIQFTSVVPSVPRHPYLIDVQRAPNEPYTLLVHLSEWLVPEPPPDRVDRLAPEGNVLSPNAPWERSSERAEYRAILEQRAHHLDRTRATVRPVAQLQAGQLQGLDGTLLATIRAMSDRRNEVSRPWTLSLNDTQRRRDEMIFNIERLYQALLFAAAHRTHAVAIDATRLQPDTLVQPDAPRAHASAFMRALSVAHALVFQETEVAVECVVHFTSNAEAVWALAAATGLSAAMRAADSGPDGGVQVAPLAELAAVVVQPGV